MPSSAEIFNPSLAKLDGPCLMKYDVTLSLFEALVKTDNCV